MQSYDVIVVGGGHAGTEAALAAARTGAQTLLVTHDLDALGQMSCNPAIGGIGKGHLVREIDALGGAMARAADQSGIQFRRLNASKGPAVRATRAQADRSLYRRAVRSMLEGQPNLALRATEVTDLSVRGDRVAGVVTADGDVVCARAVVLATGTFLGGQMFIGPCQQGGGRAGDPASLALARRLRELPLKVGRLKTGTPPRLDGKSIDFDRLQRQPGDEPVPVFSFLGSADEHPRQVCCWITHTNARTHDAIRAGLDRSPMFTGAIGGPGPRYCPSIEDKVHRFADRDRHQVFLEPEGLDSDTIYPNGISTSLPLDVQSRFIRSIAGLEAARITQPGYAIEYDYFDPRDLRPSLETRALGRLWFAGQINGTTGYEEAAAQGLVAGLNAARAAHGEAPWVPAREEAYLGVLVDDLRIQGAPEPYRMFTSRAEHRLMLREDNADLRLTPRGRELGLVDDRRWIRFTRRAGAIDQETSRLASLRVDDHRGRRLPALELLRRPDVHYADLVDRPGLGPGVDRLDVAEQVEIQARYAGYLDRQRAEIRRCRDWQDAVLPADFDYASVAGLSAEARQRLSGHRPVTVAEAARLPGITPATTALLLIHLKRRGQLRRSA